MDHVIRSNSYWDQTLHHTLTWCSNLYVLGRKWRPQNVIDINRVCLMHIRLFQSLAYNRLFEGNQTTEFCRLKIQLFCLVISKQQNNQKFYRLNIQLFCPFNTTSYFKKQQNNQSQKMTTDTNTKAKRMSTGTHISISIETKT